MRRDMFLWRGCTVVGVAGSLSRLFERRSLTGGSMKRDVSSGYHA